MLFPRQERTGTLTSLVSIHMEVKGYDLKRHLPHGTNDAVGRALGVCPTRIKSTIAYIRKKRGIKKVGPSNIVNRVPTAIQSCLSDEKLWRASHKEGPACNTIDNFLHVKLPWGGAALLIGTPTAFCVAMPNLYNNKIITDNLIVAQALQRTTERPIIIVVGDAIDEYKAILKCQHWMSISTLINPRVMRDRVDVASFMRHVTELVENNSNDICKVVLLTSGVMVDSVPILDSNGQKLDRKFGPACHELTKRYKNLHILAMATKWPDLPVKHFHGGREEVVKISNEETIEAMRKGENA